jgi:hypothetical protein
MGACVSFIENWYENGLPMYGPPCLEVGFINLLINKNFLCRSCGNIGYEFGKTHRSHLMFMSFWVSIIMLIFLVVGISSNTTDVDTVKDTSWALGTGNEIDGSASVELWLSLQVVVAKLDGFPEQSFKWDDAVCSTEFCEDCQDTTNTLLPLVWTAFITEFPAISTKITRSTARHDSNCQKFMGLFTTFMSMIATLAALAAYSNLCLQELPDKFDYLNMSFEMDYAPGPSYILVIMATVLKIFDLFVMFVVPVEHDLSRLEKNGQDNSSSGGGDHAPTAKSKSAGLTANML